MTTLTRPAPRIVPQQASPEERVHDRQSQLEQKVLLLAPSLSFWRGSYMLDKSNTSIEIGGEHLDDTASVTTPRSVLFNNVFPHDRSGQAWKKRLQTIESRQKGLIERYSVAFPIRGVRIIPKSKGAEFFQLLFGEVVDGVPQRPRINEDESIAYAMHTAAEEFCDTLPEILRQIQENMPANVWQAIQHKIPRERGVMRRKFNVDAVPIEIGGGASQAVSREDLVLHNAQVRESVHRKVSEAIDTMIREPREQLAGALRNLQELIARAGNVTAKSFKPVAAAIAKVKLFECVADDALLQQIAALENRLDRTSPSDLNDNQAIAAGFSAAIASVRAEVTNAAEIARAREEFGRPDRQIRF